MSFSNGDRVYYTSKAHGSSNNNPLIGSRWECAGTVDHPEDKYGHVTVNWDNGSHNSYSAKDLQYAKPGDTFTPNPNTAFRMRKRKKFKFKSTYSLKTGRS
jgi:hypothetical protein